MKRARSPYPGGSHATASQSAAVRKEFARAGLIREPGSPGTSTHPYTAPLATSYLLPSYLAAHPPMPPTYGSLKYLPRCLQDACLSRYPPSPPSSPFAEPFSTLEASENPPPAVTLSSSHPTDFPSPHTTRTSLLPEPPSSPHGPHTYGELRRWQDLPRFHGRDSKVSNGDPKQLGAGYFCVYRI
ncbi:Uncharacterized protein DBV15_03626 [Temnothorax longispinosus]|uniref:Uncharacterized protein n=1 Tax=Temnothorax longispinosus TaxID=300112 RepID=A0A4S2KQG8_9HYME|nr:Uncharacterized protein DBV15_03626 [Temnothorax longispinosus]